MDFELSDDQELLRDSVRRFLADQAPITGFVRPLLDDPRGTTDAVWKGLAELGVLGVLVPGVHGGAGGTMVDAGVVLEEVGRAVFPGPYDSTAVAAASLVDLAGDDDDRARWLPAIADGSLTAAVALDGTLGRVDGAGAADLILVAAGGAGDGAVVAYDVAADAIAVEPAPSVDGTRKQARVEIPPGVPGRRLGGATDRQGAAVAAVRDRVLVATVADGLGAAELALDLAVAYAKERTQFDRPIGSFQAVQHLCADMLHDVEMTRAGVYYALWACDAAPAAERHRAAVMAKAWASDALARVGANAIQVFGGIGFTWEHDVHLPYKRLLTLQQRHGGTVDQLEELARLVL